MKTVAVIAEFNPFHQGHHYFLSEVRRQSHADALVVVMSGNYVQRGEPALIDKYIRTKHALMAGADLVIELSLVAACSSAQRFAEGAIRELEKLGSIDELWFGTETGDLSMLTECADVLSDEPESLRIALKKNLENGLSYPAARANALVEYLSSDALTSSTETAEKNYAALLSEPNQILGLEYILALKKYHSIITPHTIERKGAGYHSQELHDVTFASASAIRKLLSAHNVDSTTLQPLVPEFVLTDIQLLLNEDTQTFLSDDDFSDMLLYRLIEQQNIGYSEYLDIPEDLSNRIKRLLPSYSGYEDFANRLSSRNYPISTCRRALLHILLQITAADLQTCTEDTDVHVLGFRKHEASDLLTKTKITCSGRLITKASDITNELLLRADSLYAAKLALKQSETIKHPYSRSIVLL